MTEANQSEINTILAEFTEENRVPLQQWTMAQLPVAYAEAQEIERAEELEAMCETDK